MIHIWENPSCHSVKSETRIGVKGESGYHVGAHHADARRERCSSLLPPSARVRTAEQCARAETFGVGFQLNHTLATQTLAVQRKQAGRSQESGVSLPCHMILRSQKDRAQCFSAGIDQDRFWNVLQVQSKTHSVPSASVNTVSFLNCNLVIKNHCYSFLIHSFLYQRMLINN